AWKVVHMKNISIHNPNRHIKTIKLYMEVYATELERKLKHMFNQTHDQPDNHSQNGMNITGEMDLLYNAVEVYLEQRMHLSVSKSNTKSCYVNTASDMNMQSLIIDHVLLAQSDNFSPCNEPQRL
ncbi:hypothetical protein ACJX0J_029623, partial [Zea mays]